MPSQLDVQVFKFETECKEKSSFVENDSFSKISRFYGLLVANDNRRV